MKIAFPIKEDQGLDSPVDKHFGMAKSFMIVDTKTRAFEVVPSQKHLDGKSACKTPAFSKSAGVDAVVTGCIGDGSQRGLTEAAIKVYNSGADTVAGNLDLMEKGELKLFHIFDLCQGKKNKKEGGCGHHH